MSLAGRRRVHRLAGPVRARSGAGLQRADGHVPYRVSGVQVAPIGLLLVVDARQRVARHGERGLPIEVAQRVHGGRFAVAVEAAGRRARGRRRERLVVHKVARVVVAADAPRRHGRGLVDGLHLVALVRREQLALLLADRAADARSRGEDVHRLNRRRGRGRSRGRAAPRRVARAANARGAALSHIYFVSGAAAAARAVAGLPRPLPVDGVGVDAVCVRREVPSGVAAVAVLRHAAILKLPLELGLVEHFRIRQPQAAKVDAGNCGVEAVEERIVIPRPFPAALIARVHPRAVAAADAVVKVDGVCAGSGRVLGVFARVRVEVDLVIEFRSEAPLGRCPRRYGDAVPYVAMMIGVLFALFGGQRHVAFVLGGHLHRV